VSDCSLACQIGRSETTVLLTGHMKQVIEPKPGWFWSIEPLNYPRLCLIDHLSGERRCSLTFSSKRGRTMVLTLPLFFSTDEILMAFKPRLLSLHALAPEPDQ